MKSGWSEYKRKWNKVDKSVHIAFYVFMGIYFAAIIGFALILILK